MTQPQPYTGRLTHPQKGRLHIPFEGVSIEQVRQKAEDFLMGTHLQGLYTLSIKAGRKTIKHLIIKI